MDFKKLPKTWIITGVSVLFATILICNDSFRNTLLRRRAIKKTQTEIASVERDIHAMEEKLAHLESSPSGYENLVRRDLGYLKPGEKEIRFVKTSH